MIIIMGMNTHISLFVFHLCAFPERISLGVPFVFGVYVRALLSPKKMLHIFRVCRCVKTHSFLFCLVYFSFISLGALDKLLVQQKRYRVNDGRANYFLKPETKI